MNTYRLNKKILILAGMALASLTAVFTLSYGGASQADPAQPSRLDPSCVMERGYVPDEHRVELLGGDNVQRLTDGEIDLFILTLTEVVPDYSWSPDGSKLVYSDNRVHTVGATGGNRQQISGIDRVVGNSSWSPDGRTIAYYDHGSRGAVNRLASIIFKDLESGATINVGGLIPTNAMRYSWTPDSRFLVVPGTGPNRGDEKGLVFLRRDGGASSSLSLEDEGIQTHGVIATNSAYYIWGISSEWEWPADEGSVFGPSRIFSYTSQGGARQNWQLNLLSDANSDRSFSLSPDGRRIAFVSDRDGVSQIYVMDIDGGNELRITGNDNYNSAPSWSPDSSKIVYTSFDTDNQIVDIFWKDAQPGGEEHNLTNGEGDNMNPLWSPDGKKIAFQSSRRVQGQDGDHNVSAGRLYTMGAPRTVVVSRDGVSTGMICKKVEKRPKPAPRPKPNPRAYEPKPHPSPRPNPRAHENRKEISTKQAKEHKKDATRRTKKKTKKKKKRASKKKSAVAKKKSASR